AKKRTGCEPLCTQFINLTPKSKNAIWNYGDRPYEQAGDTTYYCYQKAGTYQLWLSVTDSNSCKTSFTYSNAIQVLVSSQADLVTDPARLTLKEPNVLIKNITAFGTDYKWYEGDHFLAGTQNINYTFSDTGCYKFMLIAHNENNCSDSVTK